MPDDTTAEVASALRLELDERLASRDKAGAVSAALDAVRDKGLRVDALYTQVLGPLLVDTGVAWQAGSTRVWEEHFASATVRTIIETIYPEVLKQAATRSGRVAVLACPPKELHDLALRMLTDRMTLAGWDAYFLGSDTPVSEIIDAATELGAEVVVLSAATHYSRMMLRTVVAELQAGLPSNVKLGVGGPAFRHDPSWPGESIIAEDRFAEYAFGDTEG